MLESREEHWRNHIYIYSFARVRLKSMYNTVYLQHSKYNQIHLTAWDYLAFMLCFTLGTREFPSLYRRAATHIQENSSLKVHTSKSSLSLSKNRCLSLFCLLLRQTVSPQCFKIPNTHTFISQSLAGVAQFFAGPPGVLSAQLPLPTCSSSPISSDHQLLLVCSRCLCPTSVLHLYGSSFFPLMSVCSHVMSLFLTLFIFMKETLEPAAPNT